MSKGVDKPQDEAWVFCLRLLTIARRDGILMKRNDLEIYFIVSGVGKSKLSCSEKTFANISGDGIADMFITVR